MAHEVTLPSGEIVTFPDETPDNEINRAISNYPGAGGAPPPASASAPLPGKAPPSGPVAAAQGWLQTISAAQQGTSPIVRDIYGNLNYKRLGNPIDTDAGPGYIDSSGKWQLVNPAYHVTLTDPATGQPTVFERNEDTEEGRASAFGRLLPFGVLSGSPTVAGAVRPPGSPLASVAASPVTKTVANIATGIGTTKLAESLGLPGEAAGIIGASLGLGSHASGLGGDILDHIARWLAARPGRAAVPAVNYGAPIPVTGLLGTVPATISGAGGQPPYVTP